MSQFYRYVRFAVICGGWYTVNFRVGAAGGNGQVTSVQTKAPASCGCLYNRAQMESKSVIRSGVADSLLIESYPSFITIAADCLSPEGRPNAGRAGHEASQGVGTLTPPPPSPAILASQTLTKQLVQAIQWCFFVTWTGTMKALKLGQRRTTDWESENSM